MDGDPHVEPELDPFSLFLPLPYRVAVIIICGEWDVISIWNAPAYCYSDHE